MEAGGFQKKNTCTVAVKKYMKEYIDHVKMYRGWGPEDSLTLEDGNIVRRAKNYLERMTLPELIAAVKRQREFREKHKP